MFDLTVLVINAGVFAFGFIAGVLVGRKNREHVDQAVAAIQDEYEELIAKLEAERDELAAKLSRKKVVK